MQPASPGPIDTANAIEWGHPDNAGLACLLVSPSGTGGGAGSVLKDLTGKTAGATLIGGAAWAGTVNSQAGPVLTAASAQYLDTPVTLGPAGTIALWVQPAFNQDTSARYIFDSQGTRTLLYQNTQAVGAYGLYVNDTQVSDTPSGLVGLCPVAGVSRRVLFTWDGAGNGVDIYRDGQLFAHFNATPGSSSGALRFGSRYTGQDYWSGQLYGQRVLNRRVPAAEAARDYEWSQDPQRDPRLRRASTRSYFVTTAGVPTFSFVPAFASGWGW